MRDDLGQAVEPLSGSDLVDRKTHANGPPCLVSDGPGLTTGRELVPNAAPLTAFPARFGEHVLEPAQTIGSAPMPARHAGNQVDACKLMPERGFC